MLVKLCLWTSSCNLCDWTAFIRVLLVVILLSGWSLDLVPSVLFLLVGCIFICDIWSWHGFPGDVFWNVESVGFINYKEFVNTLTTYSREFFWVILMIWPKQNWCKCWQEMKIFSRLRWIRNENLTKIFRNFLKNSVKSKIDLWDNGRKKKKIFKKHL